MKVPPAARTLALRPHTVPEADVAEHADARWAASARASTHAPTRTRRQQPLSERDGAPALGRIQR